MKKALRIIPSILLLAYCGHIHAASYLEQYQQDTQKALDLKNKQLKEMYDKNREETMQASQKRAAAAQQAQQPTQPPQPAWEQAVAPANPASTPAPAPTPTVAPPPPPVAVSPADNPASGSTKPAAPAASANAPTNIYQPSAGQNTTPTSNPYR